MDTGDAAPIALGECLTTPTNHTAKVGMEMWRAGKGYRLAINHEGTAISGHRLMINEAGFDLTQTDLADAAGDGMPSGVSDPGFSLTGKGIPAGALHWQLIYGTTTLELGSNCKIGAMAVGVRLMADTAGASVNLAGRVREIPAQVVPTLGTLSLSAINSVLGVLRTNIVTQRLYDSHCIGVIASAVASVASAGARLGVDILALIDVRREVAQ